MKWNLRSVVKAFMMIATFAFSAWITFVGFYVNFVRIQSTFFSVSGVAFFLMIIGFIGVISSIVTFWFPRPAGIVSSLAMAVIAGVALWDLAAVYRLEFLYSILRRLVLPLLLAAVVFTLFVIEPEDQRYTTDDNR